MCKRRESEGAGVCPPPEALLGPVRAVFEGAMSARGARTEGEYPRHVSGENGGIGGKLRRMGPRYSPVGRPGAQDSTGLYRILPIFYRGKSLWHMAFYTFYTFLHFLHQNRENEQDDTQNGENWRYSLYISNILNISLSHNEVFSSW